MPDDVWPTPHDRQYSKIHLNYCLSNNSSLSSHVATGLLCYIDFPTAAKATIGTEFSRANSNRRAQMEAYNPSVVCLTLAAYMRLNYFIYSHIDLNVSEQVFNLEMRRLIIINLMLFQLFAL